MMKVCIPINNVTKFDINTDISNSSKILIYDAKDRDYKIVDVSNMNLGERIKYMEDNGVEHLVAEVTIPQHYKYITSKGITIYEPNKNVNALDNGYLLLAKQLNANYTSY